jgi:hypothetical protein
VGTSFWRTGSAAARFLTVGLFALGLVACGETIDTGTLVTPPVPLSPQAGEVPEEINSATATIVDGQLDPNSFGGQIGTAFELVVTGDGTEHTLAIEELVDGSTIAADGQTTVAFTIEGEPGTLNITLDGNPAGTFERQAASGADDL